MIPGSVLSDEVAWIFAVLAIGAFVTIISAVVYAIATDQMPWHHKNAFPPLDGTHEQIHASETTSDRVHAGV